MPTFETSVLWVPLEGIYKVTTYFSDGSIEEKLVRMSPAIRVEEIRHANL